MTKFYHLLLPALLLIALASCGKNGDKTLPGNKYTATWKADMAIHKFYENGAQTGADTFRTNSYFLILKSNGTGTTANGTTTITKFNYTIANDQINYTNFVYYTSTNPNGIPDHDYSEKILSATDTKLVTSLKQTDDYFIDIYFTKTN